MLCIVLIVTLIASQWYILSEKNAVAVSSPETVISGIHDTVTLSSSVDLREGDAYVYLNGDEYAPFIGNSFEIGVYANSVVEVLSCKKSDFFVTCVSAENNLTVIPIGDKIKCKKGINYICRVISSQ